MHRYRRNPHPSKAKTPRTESKQEKADKAAAQARRDRQHADDQLRDAGNKALSDYARREAAWHEQQRRP